MQYGAIHAKGREYAEDPMGPREIEFENDEGGLKTLLRLKIKWSGCVAG